MAMTARERLKKHRQKLKEDPAKYAVYLEKQRAYVAAKRKKVSEMSKREHQRAKKIWKESKKKQRAKEKAANFRPPSPPPECDSPPQVEPSGNQRRGRRVVLKNRSASVRENFKLKEIIADNQETIRKLQTECEKYRKRAYRLEKSEKLVEVYHTSKSLLTPQSAAKKELSELIPNATPKKRKKILSSEVAKKLTFCNVVSECIQQAPPKHKKVISNVLVNSLTSHYHKYRMLKRAGKLMGLTRKKQILRNPVIKENKTRFVIESFFLCDDVSRNTAGMKETVTRRKVKMQKRYLIGSMKKLFVKFKQRYSYLKVSYTTFTRYRPFYVCKPTINDRDTCLCQKHTNMNLIASKLKHLGILDSEDPHEVVESVVCSKRSVPCMYNRCQYCKEQGIELGVERDGSQSISWEQWGRVVEEKEGIVNGEKVKKSYTVSRKCQIKGTIDNLLDEFNKLLRAFRTHIYNVKNQNEEFRNVKATLDSSTAVIQIDFSENFACKLAEEVQSFHFGAARNQVTIHTGVLYLRDEKAIPFSTISPCLDHGPHAIWAHLEPVLKMIENDYPNVKIIHFYSDGPSTQYRQKGNFYLFTKTMVERGFCGTWSFFEAGHGKGAADGIGGALKRSANGLVARGTDIPDAQTFFSLLSPTSKIRMFFISENEVVNIKKKIPNSLQPIKGTFQIHQIAAWTQYEIAHRPLSCYCENNNFLRNKFCECNFKYTMSTLLQHESLEPRDELRDIPEESDVDDDNMSIHDESSPLHMSDIEYMDSEEEVEMETVDLSNIKTGKYVLVEFLGGKRKKSKFHYVGVCRTAVEDGDILVTFLNVVGENNTLFSMNETDECYITTSQVVAMLPDPLIKLKGDRIYYKFPKSVNVSCKR